ncbi:hypothetical protein [Streptomyces sp. NPDC059063]|uniref:hypothetical protein n=1 Tax=unclassified Streptomyces TaxID=2593676 RepID=UPI0036A7893C
MSEPFIGRLLPWMNAEGKPCFLISGDDGQVARVADQMERIQLGMADDLLGHANATLADDEATPGQLRYVATCLTESLRQVQVIAKSRGDRLTALGYDSDDIWQRRSGEQ